MFVDAPQAQVAPEQDVDCLAQGAGEGVAARRRASTSARHIHWWANGYGARLIAYPSRDQWPVDLPPEGKEAIAGVRFILGAKGRATACAVERSTGTAALDRASCDLVMRHAVSQPAVRGGTLVEADVRIAVAWAPDREDAAAAACRSSGGAIPLDYPSYIAGCAFGPNGLRHDAGLHFALRISEIGQPVACTVIRATEPPGVQQRFCSLMQQTLRLLPATDEAGRLVPTTVTSVLHFGAD